MRIAFHTPSPSYLDPNGMSGDVTYVHGLVDGFRGAGHKVEIVSRLSVADVSKGRIPTRALLAETRSVRKRMRNFQPDVWVVYMSSVRTPDLFGWWQRPKAYVHLGPGGHQTKKPVPRRWRRVLGLAHRRALARADAVVAFYPRSADELVSLGIPQDRVHLLPPAPAGWRTMPARPEARRRLRLPLDAPVVLCVSRFARARVDGTPYKTEAVLDLIRATRSLPLEAVLVVVGDGPGRGRVESQVETAARDRCVRLDGAVPTRDISWYFAACDFVAYPCQRDRPWVALLEAQMCGRPVVTMRTRSAEVTVRDQETGLLADDLEEFEGQIAMLARDRARCEEMGRAGRRYAEALHSIDVRVRQIEAVLKKGIEVRRSAAHGL
jgi:glycosyltransferase involved in cell wall biosynthesis